MPNDPESQNLNAPQENQTGSSNPAFGDDMNDDIVITANTSGGASGGGAGSEGTEVKIPTKESGAIPKTPSVVTTPLLERSNKPLTEAAKAKAAKLKKDLVEALRIGKIHRAYEKRKNEALAAEAKKAKNKASTSKSKENQNPASPGAGPSKSSGTASVGGAVGGGTSGFNERLECHRRAAAVLQERSKHLTREELDKMQHKDFLRHFDLLGALDEDVDEIMEQIRMNKLQEEGNMEDIDLNASPDTKEAIDPTASPNPATWTL